MNAVGATSGLRRGKREAWAYDGEGMADSQLATRAVKMRIARNVSAVAKLIGMAMSD